MVAGLTGLLLAASALQARAVAPVKHLRTLNPYVAAATSDWRRRCGLVAAIPMQGGPGGGAAESEAGGRCALAGTSSFGMSGVNAHALLAAPASQQPASPAGPKVCPPCNQSTCACVLSVARPGFSLINISTDQQQTWRLLALKQKVRSVQGSGCMSTMCMALVCRSSCMRGAGTGAHPRRTRCCAGRCRASRPACCACSAACRKHPWHTCTTTR